jgi:hypothetical protein
MPCTYIRSYVANKCSIASRIDCFSESLTDKFGLQMRDQVEERLRFYETGEAPRKNVDVMKAVLDSINIEDPVRLRYFYIHCTLSPTLHRCEFC